MNHHPRMSPLTALFIGIFGVTAVGITAGGLIVLYGMNIVDGKASSVLGLTKSTIDELPELLDSLPSAVADTLNDRRAPEYAAKIEIDATLIEDQRTGYVRPVLTITNRGDQVISMLAIRVAALEGGTVPVGDWTQVVATPIAIDDDWPGLLFPNTTRHVVASRSWRGQALPGGRTLTATTEISELRLWMPQERSVRTASAID